MIAVWNAVACLNLLGVAAPFGLVCLVADFLRSGLTVRSWSSGRFCLCWSGGVRTLLVRSSMVVLIYLGRPYLVCSVLLCPSLVCSLWSALVWSRLLCSSKLVAVDLGPVLFALVCSGLVHSALH